MARAPRTAASKSGGASKSPAKGRGRAKAASSGKAPAGSKARSASKAPSRSKSPVATNAQRRAPPASKTASPSGAKRGPAQKRSTSKSQPRRKSQPMQSWGGALAAMVTSQLGRDILSDVLVAAAAALRKDRPGVETSTRAPDTGDRPTSITAEVAAGTATLASTAINVLAGAVTDSALTALDGIAAEDRER